MMILVDTNVWSEVTKARRELRVVDWLRRHESRTLLSVLVIGEIEQGISMTSGPDKRRILADWKNELVDDHRDRIVPFDLDAAILWGSMAGMIRREGRGTFLIDVMLAAQARTLGVPLATRNQRDFSMAGVEIIDPWNA